MGSQVWHDLLPPLDMSLMRHHLAPSVLVVLCAAQACTPSTNRTSTSDITSAASNTGAPTIGVTAKPQESAAPQAVPLFAEIARPRMRGCAFDGLLSVALRVRPEGEGVVRLWNTVVRATTTPEAPLGVWLEATRDAIAVAGWGRASDVPLFVTQPIIFGGIWSPSGSAPLGWRPGSAVGEVQLSAPAEHPSLSRAGTALVLEADVTVPCAAVRMTAVPLDPLAAWSLPRALESGLIAQRAGASLPLFATATAGSAAGTLRLDEDVRVTVHERRAGRAEVAFAVADGRVVGWVEAGAVAAAPSTGSSHRVKPPVTRSDPVTVEPAGEARICPFELPVGVARDGVMLRIGTAALGTKLVVLSSEGPLAGVAIPAALPWIAPSLPPSQDGGGPRAHWLADASLVARCVRASPDGLAL